MGLSAQGALLQTMGLSPQEAHKLQAQGQAARLHQALAGQPGGNLPLTYTIELPHKKLEDLYTVGM